MDDLGKILYEMHVESVRENAERITQRYLKAWDDLEEDAKQAWRDTAAKFGEWARS